MDDKLTESQLSNWSKKCSHYANQLRRSWVTGTRPLDVAHDVALELDRMAHEMGDIRLLVLNRMLDEVEKKEES